MVEEDFKYENECLFVISPKDTIKLETVRPSNAARVLHELSGVEESRLQNYVKDILSLRDKKVFNLNDDVSDLVYDAVGDVYDGDGVYTIKFNSLHATPFRFYVTDQVELAEYVMFCMIAAGQIDSVPIHIDMYFRGKQIDDLSNYDIDETLMYTMYFATEKPVSLLPQYEDAPMIIGDIYPSEEFGVVYIDSKDFGTIVRWNRCIVRTFNGGTTEGGWEILLDEVEGDRVNPKQLGQYLEQHYTRIIDKKSISTKYENENDEEDNEDEYEDDEYEKDEENEYEDEDEYEDEEENNEEDENYDKYKDWSYDSENKSSWLLGKVDGDSVEIIFENQSIELIPLNKYTVYRKIMDNAIPCEKAYLGRRMHEQLTTLENKEWIFLDKCTNKQMLSSILEPLMGEDRTYTVRFNKAGKSKEFQFFATDDSTLVGYVLSFMIAAGLGKVDDITHYYRNKKVKKFTSYSWSKTFVTVITFKDGRKMIVYESSNDGFYIMLGRVKIDNKFIIQYGEDVDILYWAIDKTSGREEVNAIGIGELYDESDFI